MENEKSIFNLELDGIAKNHLTDTAKWARFLAIAGLIGLALILIASIFVSINNATSHDDFETSVNRSAYIAGSMLPGIIMAVLYFFPCYFLLKFANKMKNAIAADDGASLNEALKNLKVTFRYVGVLTIIFLALFLIGMLANLSSGS